MLKYKATAAAIKSAVHFRPLLLTASLAVSLAAAQGAAAAELVVNGGFEAPVVTYEQGWMSYYGDNAPEGYCESQGEAVCPEETIPGWDVVWRDTAVAGDPMPGRVELQSGAVGGVTARSGDQKAELDSHYRAGENADNNVIIAQALQTCPGNPYTLRYSWKARNDVPGDNDVLFLIDDEVLVTLTDFRETWTDVEYNFFANDSGFSGLAFTSIGTSTLLGMFIDEVSVTGPDGSDPETCEPPPSACEKDKPITLTLLYDADLDGEDSYTQDPSEVSIESFYDEEEGLPAYVQIKVYDHFRKRDKRTELFNEMVEVGHTFTIEGPRKRIPPRLFIDIHSTTGELLQSIEFHSSCSQPLDVGDEFGGIAIWGFTL